MRAYGSAGALVIADKGIDLPLEPVRYRDRLADVESKWTVRSPIPAQSPEPAAPRVVQPAPKPAPRRQTDTEWVAKRAQRAASREAATQALAEARAATAAAKAARRDPAIPLVPDPEVLARVEADRQARIEQRLATLAANQAAREAKRAAQDADAEARRVAGLQAAESHLQQLQSIRTALIDDLRERWQAGQSQDEIAEALNIAVSTVQRLRRESGIERRRKPIDQAEAVRLYEQHRNADTVAELMGASVQGVRYQLRKSGITIRRPGENGLALPDTVRVGALAAYEAGRPCGDIYAEFGITETTLARWRREAGIAIRPGRGQR